MEKPEKVDEMDLLTPTRYQYHYYSGAEEDGDATSVTSESKFYIRKNLAFLSMRRNVLYLEPHREKMKERKMEYLLRNVFFIFLRTYTMWVLCALDFVGNTRVYFFKLFWSV